ncbi:LysR family transcriptional regulator [Desulfovibrio sp. TomC]|uniref:LysR family transcriptional regulator n=1 Tax=Desulfovibrio sp. TomC TaxID=1562888 RepID=UPI00057471CC|nr:LysR family transcriptional regulator [Desulfovibrio sp. TomC]KHK01620.1 transcriptional regulator, LysR family [Desulfovibrio sp. TomC]
MHMLDPWQLHTFLTAAAAGSLRQAARELALSPSAVTARIKALEQTVGVALFHRTGNRVTVTEHGRRLSGYARRLLDLEAEARQKLAGDDDEATSLSVRLSESLGLAVLPVLLPRFRRRFPCLRLTLATRSDQGLVRDLRQGVVDCGIVLGQPYVAEGVTATVIHRERLVVVAAPHDPLAGRGRVIPADLHGRELLVTRHVWSARERVEQALLRAGAIPAAVTSCTSLEMLLRCVVAGHGLALAPELAVADRVRAGQLASLAWDDGSLDAAVTVMTLTGRRPSTAQTVFLHLLRQSLQNGGYDPEQVEPSQP